MRHESLCAKILNSGYQNIATLLDLFQICPFNHGMSACPSGAEHDSWYARGGEQGRIHPRGIPIDFRGSMKERFGLFEESLHNVRVLRNLEGFPH